MHSSQGEGLKDAAPLDLERPLHFRKYKNNQGDGGLCTFVNLEGLVRLGEMENQGKSSVVRSHGDKRIGLAFHQLDNERVSGGGESCGSANQTLG